MRIVVALGGNALLRRGERPDAAPQLAQIQAGARALAPLAREHELLICHGNGPQVGLLALESATDLTLSRAYPLDALVAQTQGMIGYWLSQALTNAGAGKPVLALMTQVVVDPADPAFSEPTKFIGPVYDRTEATQLASDHGWTVAPDGPHWRRVVPSPLPVEIVEQAAIGRLLSEQAIVICGGGGGAPVAVDGAGLLSGVEAVVDKDLTAAMLAVAVHADRLLVLTDVAAVMSGFGTTDAAPLHSLSVNQAKALDVPAGSMGPKIDACLRFVTATGKPATIGALADAVDLLAEKAGTTIHPPDASVRTNGPTRAPRRAGEPAADTRVVETHTATLLMTGDRVYKWKKPLDLGFVDFRELSARQRACQDEVALNRRLAADVYLGVDRLLRDDGTLQEPVVVMRRLPDSTRLSTLVTSKDGMAAGPLHLIARLIADFHTRCEPSPDPHAVAGLDRLRELWKVGLDALAVAAPDVLSGADLAEAQALVSSYLLGRGPLLQHRIDQGRVRDGHGDLLADDIFCLPDGPRVLDCLDFDASLRHGDVLGDIATLAMDLERLGDQPAADRLIRDYVEFADEQHPASLRHLYIAYRAQVRAKVALVRAAQSAEIAVQQAQRQQARELVSLMLAHLRQTSVALVLVGGLPGTGKSTVAQGLSDATGCLVHSSDLVRRELNLPQSERYTEAGVGQVYDELLRRARLELQQGWTVVLDASWTSPRWRERARELARETSVELLEVHCQVSAEVATRRLAARGPDHPSEADPEVRRTLQARGPEPERGVVTITTDGPAPRSIEAAGAALEHVALRARHRVLQLDRARS